MRLPTGFFIGFALTCAALTISSSAQTFQTLASFNMNNGAFPERMSLVQGRDGRLYGTTEEGGIEDCQMAVGCGTIFQIAGDGELVSLYRFCSQPSCSDGDEPLAGLLLGNDGYFYGTTVAGADRGCLGGCGTIFRITGQGKLTTLHRFCPRGLCPGGSNPAAALVQGIDGNFYGTADGGANSQGIAFKMSPSGTPTTLYNFCSQPNCADGQIPNGLAQGTDGNFYGTTASTVFRISPSGTLKTLYTFCSQRNCADGSDPEAGLVQGSDGDFYGTTAGGGTHGCCNGTVFKITPEGALTTLYSFCALPDCADGSEPLAGLIQATDGNFYGTTSWGGIRRAPLRTGVAPCLKSLQPAC